MPPAGGRAGRVLFAGLTAAATVLLVLLLASCAVASPQVIVELENNARDATRASTFPSQPIAGTDGARKQAYKFERERQGGNFAYSIAGLRPGGIYDIEVSFVEHDFATLGQRVFNVYVQGALAVGSLDISSRVGSNSALQFGLPASADARGVIKIAFRSDVPGGVNLATISTITLSEGSTDVVEVDASTSRNTLVPPPVRRYNNSSQDAYEVVLGRLGSRACLDLLPQQLFGRYSSLGTWTGDLAEMVIAVKYAGKVRALPFTDRFPVWERIDQSETMTGVTFKCSSDAMPFELTVAFRAPFYPQNEKVSSAPFFYIDITLVNKGSSTATPSLIFAMPHKEELAFSGLAHLSDGTAAGMAWRTSYSYSDETVARYGCKAASEGLALSVPESAGVSFLGNSSGEFADFSSSALWGWSTPGYPCSPTQPGSPVYSFYPRGYSGARWQADAMPPGGASSKHFVLAGYVSDPILNVSNRYYSDSAFRFRYVSTFASVQAVIDYAVSDRSAGDDIAGKSSFFDSVFSSSKSLDVGSPTSALRPLIACSFRTWLTNTWWAHSSSGRDWFSVWEGTWMRFHSTIDVEYNEAWLYYSLWPSLLKCELDEWLLCIKYNEAGAYLPHDVGIVDQATGQAYDHDMPVEENLNFLLMLYRYWKSSGDTACVTSRWANIKAFTQFVMACDTNGNGMPDKYSETTFDDGTPALEGGRDQTYLGFKCLAAYRAVREMALVAEPSFASACQSKVDLLNERLATDSWLADHYAVALDPTTAQADREAYSIYSGSGLLYLLGGQRDTGLSPTNQAYLARDIAESTARTWGPYGSKHTSNDPGRMWVSSNIWRDALACYLGASLRGGSPLAGAETYWDFEKRLAMLGSGGYWDGTIYGRSAGVSPANERSAGVPPANERSAGVPPAISDPGAGVPPPVGIVAERPIYFNYHGAWTGGHDVVGATTPSSTFYFAEGTCRPGFDPYICVQNPEAAGAHVKVTYMTGDGSVKTTEIDVPPNSRATLRPKDTLGEGDDAAHDFSAKVESTSGTGIVAERPIYFNYHGSWTGGHDVVGATTPATTFYFAEGTTRPGFDPYICVQNPEAAGAHVKVTYMTGDGSVKTKEIDVPPNSRATVLPKETLGEGDDAAHDFSAKVESTSGTGIVAERPIYFNYHGAWTGGHDVVGATAPSSTFYFAEGTCRPGFDPYICVQNPEAASAHVKVTYMTGDGSVKTTEIDVPPNSRATQRPKETLGEGDDAAHDFSAKVESTNGAGIVAERPIYFNYHGAWTGGHDVVGATTPSSTFYFAEGTCRPGFDPYICVQNPEAAGAHVKVTYMTGDGSVKTTEIAVPPNSRATLRPKDTLGEGDDAAHDFSAKVEATDGTAGMQLMSYYPRGAASFGLIDAAACLTIDNPENALYYRPTSYPLRVPVLNRADWSNPDPTKRVPLIYFRDPSSPVFITNRSLLPATVGPR